MVVRRLHEHVATHNWFAVAVDLAIVMLGVFLGLQANNWNQARVARADAAAYRAQIIENLRVNEADIGVRIGYYGQVRKHALAALAAIETPGAVKEEAFIVDSYQATQVWQRPLVQTAYDEMSSAGLGRSIGGAETRQRVTGFYTQMQQFNVTALSNTDYRERARRAIPFAVQERMRAACGDIVDELPSGVLRARLPDRCRPGLEPAMIARAAARLSATPGLDQDLTRHLADIDQKLNGLGNFSRRAAALRQHLEAVEKKAGE
ncbi:MAG: hypothetical protein ABIR25_05100 [Sphingomicrobium sp.]